MEYQAHHDGLTGLPNRVEFISFIEKTLATAQTHKDQFAIAFIDLDHFKTVNDSLSHAIGDALLTQVAERLKGRIRASDIVARLGGDEFVVVWTNFGHLNLSSALCC